MTERIAVIEVPAFTSAPLFTTRQRLGFARTTIAGWSPIFEKVPGEPAVTRLVDLDCGAGVFASFAGVRFPYAWLDCYFAAPSTAEERALVNLNAPVGTRVFDELPAIVPACDALHVGLRAKGLQFTTENLAQLSLALWEWESSETLESATGLLRAVGLEVVHTSTVEPGRGWSLYFRKHAFSGVTDLTPARGPTPASKEASPS